MGLVLLLIAQLYRVEKLARLLPSEDRLRLRTASSRFDPALQMSEGRCVRTAGALTSTVISVAWRGLHSIRSPCSRKARTPSAAAS
jgi:hypothetical protein